MCLWNSNWLMMVIWVALVIGFLYVIVRTTQSKSSTNFNESALDILKKRYARGEITHDEFLQIKNEIQK